MTSGPVPAGPPDRDRLAPLVAHALAEARKAPPHGDVPVGALVVHTSSFRVVAARHNERELLGDPTAHAEVLAVRDAAAAVGSWRLEGHFLVVTLEPCVMCAGAVWASRLDGIVYGAPDPKAGAAGSLYGIPADPRLNHESWTQAGVLAEECGALLQEFFAGRRGPA